MGKSKKALLLAYIKDSGEVSSAQIYKWGDDNFSHRAKRNARQLAKDGYLEPFSKPDSALVWYRVIELKPKPEPKPEPKPLTTQQHLPLGVEL